MTLVDLLLLLDEWECGISQDGSDLLFSPTRPLTGEEMATLKAAVREHKAELLRRAPKAVNPPPKIEGPGGNFIRATDPD